jgi:predicted RNase H-like nuclease (RuvC/YqgF family)
MSSNNNYNYSDVLGSRLQRQYACDIIELPEDKLTLLETKIEKQNYKLEEQEKQIYNLTKIVCQLQQQISMANDDLEFKMNNNDDIHLEYNTSNEIMSNKDTLSWFNKKFESLEKKMDTLITPTGKKNETKFL